jgi:hypothetical protein
MAGSKKPYSLDEYYKDKYGGQTAMSPLNRAGSRSPGSVKPVSSVHAGAMQKRQQILSSMNPIEKPQQPTAPTQPAPTQQATGATTTVQKPEQAGVLTQSQLTTADTMRMLEDALASLAEWGNRKFVYNAKESPLYTILQQQAEKEARLASGRAYSRAVANTGGFGSSYATLAAEEAGRQVMEGLDDQQLALYQAAREEFEAERQSRVDWYNTAKQLHNDRMALDELQAIEAAAKASGMNTDTYNLLQTAVAEGWYDGTNKATVRNKLETMALGNPNINVDAIMTQLEGGQKAQMTDLVSGLSINPTLSGAAEIMAQAKVNGTEAEVLPEVSKQIGQALTGALGSQAKLGSAYSILGINEENWSAMSAEDKEVAVLDAAADAYKSGYMTWDDYKSLTVRNAKDTLQGIVDSNDSDTKKAKATIDTISGILYMEQTGVITAREADQILDELVNTTAVVEARKTLTPTEIMIGPNLYQLPTGKDISPQILNDAQEEAYGRLISAMYRTGVLKAEKGDQIMKDITSRFDKRKKP